MDSVQMFGLFVVGAVAVWLCLSSIYLKKELSEANVIIEKLTEDKRKLEDNLNFSLNKLGERERELTQLSNELHGCQSCLSHTSKELEETKSRLNRESDKSAEAIEWLNEIFGWVEHAPSWIVDATTRIKND